MVITELSDSLYPLDRCRYESTLALKRLNNNRSNGICSCTLFKYICKRIHIVIKSCLLWHSLRIPVVIWELCPEHAICKLSHTLCISLLGCHGHCVMCSAVESSRKYDDIRSLCKALCNLYSILISLSTTVCEEHLLLVALYWCDGRKLLSECHISLMGYHIEHAVEIFVSLCLDSLNDLRL